MSAPAKPNETPVTDRRQLIDHLASGGKPAADWRIGTEHEKFGFTLDDLRPLPYEGERGIQAVLTGLAQHGWSPVHENGHLIALINDNGASVTLEPGGQLELSGAPLSSIHETCEETYDHLQQVRDVCAPLGIGFVGLGFQPKWQRQDMQWMPKGRYRIMRDYMPKRGSKGIDMMIRTCTVQVNLDFADEADMIQKFRLSLALQPLATALFASSPFCEGQPTGMLSGRSDVWTDTDPDRCGMLPFVFENGMGFERYVDWMLDVPMYFVYRNGTYIDASGQSFRDFLAGKLPALPGEVPTLGDWNDHLTTAFPEVRLKKYLEMRGADSGPWRRLCALPAFWVGLLYDSDVMAAAWDVVKDWSLEQRQQLRIDAPRLGFGAQVNGHSLLEIGRHVLELSAHGLRRRNLLNNYQQDEAIYLDGLRDSLDRGKTPAEDMLEAFHGRWNGSVDPLFKDYAY